MRHHRERTTDATRRYATSNRTILETACSAAGISLVDGALKSFTTHNGADTDNWHYRVVDT